MKNAIEVCLSGQLGYKKATTQFNIPRSTLTDRVKSVRKGKTAEQAAKKGLGLYKTVFTEAQQSELVSHLMELERKLFGLTYFDLQKLVYELAEKNNVAHSFNRTNQTAGKIWVQGFFKRHLDLAIRTAEKTSAPRAMAFNRTAVKNFLDCLTNRLI